MLFLKKTFAYLWRYLLGIFIAFLVSGIISLIFKIALITVQGPTTFSRVSAAIVFYVALSVAFFFLFRHYGKKQSSRDLKEFTLYTGGIVTLHMIIAFLASWSTLWRISSGSLTLTILLYAGGDAVNSLTEIPRAYYLVALAIEDICFIVFSLIGYRKGIRK